MIMHDYGTVSQLYCATVCPVLSLTKIGYKASITINLLIYLFMTLRLELFYKQYKHCEHAWDSLLY